MRVSAERATRARAIDGSRTALFVAAGAIFTVLAALLPTWVDEEYTLRTTAHGALYAFGQAVTFENQAPLYFTLLGLWRLIDPGSVFFARAFSVVCAVAAVAFGVRLAERVAPGRTGIAYGIALAASPFLVFAAVEIRLYAMGVALSAALMLTWFDGFFEPRAGRVVASRIAFVVLAVAALWTEYYLGFLLVALGAALLVRPRRLLSYVGSCAAVAIAGLLPLVPIVRAQLPSEHGKLGLAASLKRALDPFFDFAFPHEWVASSASGPHAAYYAGAVLFAGLLLAGRPRLDRILGATWIAAVTIAVLYVVAAVGLKIDLIVPRHELTLLVPLTLALYATVTRMRRPAPGWAAVVMFGVTTLASLGVAYGGLSKSADARNVAAYLDAHVGSRDAVAVFDMEEVMPLQRYVNPRITLIPIPRALRFRHFSSSEFAIRSTAEAEAAIGPRVLQHRTLWLMRDSTCGVDGHNYGCDYLDAVLARDYRPLHVQRFYKATVTQFAPR